MIFYKRTIIKIPYRNQDNRSFVPTISADTPHIPDFDNIICFSINFHSFERQNNNTFTRQFYQLVVCHVHHVMRWCIYPCWAIYCVVLTYAFVTNKCVPSGLFFPQGYIPSLCVCLLQLFMSLQGAYMQSIYNIKCFYHLILPSSSCFYKRFWQILRSNLGNNNYFIWSIG